MQGTSLVKGTASTNPNLDVNAAFLQGGVAAPAVASYGAEALRPEEHLIRELDRAYLSLRTLLAMPNIAGLSAAEAANSMLAGGGSGSPQSALATGSIGSAPSPLLLRRSHASGLGLAYPELSAGGSIPPASSNRPPLATVEDRGANYRISLEMPGVPKEKLTVRVNDRSVDIHGWAEAAREEAGKLLLLSERPLARFQRSFELPESVIAEKGQARYQDGILELILPKAHPSPELTVK